MNSFSSHPDSQDNYGVRSLIRCGTNDGHSLKSNINKHSDTTPTDHSAETADIIAYGDFSDSAEQSPVSLISARLDEINDSLDGADVDDVLHWGYTTFGREMAFGTGFGLPGIYLLHRIHQLELDIPLFFLDTRLLFTETYELRERLQEKLGVEIEAVTPEIDLYEQTKNFGSELWIRKPDQCCHIRKVAPLQKYLANKKAWITGIRRGQSATRKHVRMIEYDPLNDVIKINPLVSSDINDIRQYIGRHALPYNPLHDDGYPSIGCIPCTSPVFDGEDERAGRWRGEVKTECGIHLPNLSGSAERLKVRGNSQRLK
jgi:phosphoadenosine phosphosulfate reductase